MQSLARRLSKLIVVGTLGVLAGAGLARAQDNYPSHPIKIIVGYAPGGNVDVPARLFAPELSRILGAPVVVENRPGASGVPAAEMVMRAKPDGYTLIWGTSASHSVSVVAMAPLSFDPVKDFAPITLISLDGNVIVATPNFPASDLKSFVDYVKKNPRTPIGTSGPATSGRFAVELMKPKLGLELKVVPYRSAGPMMVDVVGGHVPLGILGASTAVPLIKEGKVKAIAVTSMKRSSVLPDLPTFDETVSKGFEAVAWSALYAPPGTPDAIVAKLNAAMRQVSQLPAIKKWLDEAGLEVPMGSPKQLIDFMKDDIQKWVQVAKENDLKIEAQ